MTSDINLFVRFPRAATFDPRLSPRDKEVLAALGWYTNKQARCRVSPATLARRLGIGLRAMQGHLKNLRATGYVKALGWVEMDDGQRAKMLKVEFPETHASFVSSDEETHASFVSEKSDTDRNARQLREKTHASFAPRTRYLEQYYSLSERGTRGSRFSKTGILPNAWREFAQQERPDLDPDRTFAAFEDYWTAKPGKDGLKSDWMATWRNWVRRERGHTTRPTSKSQATRDAVDRLIEEADRDG